MSVHVNAMEHARVRLQRLGSHWMVEIDNQSRRNAFTWDMYEDLRQICIEAQADPDLRVMVIRGAGGRAFAAGTDINQFTEFTGLDGVSYEHTVGAILNQLLDIRVPVLALVDGPAVGAGLAVAACCDIVIATPDAKFGAPIARTLGNCLPPQVIARLQSRLGASRTMAMLLASTLISAEEAQAGGLVHRVVEREESDDVLRELTDRIAAGAPLTLAGLKEIDRRLNRSRAEVFADDVLESCYGSADFGEGVQAFLDKRRPVWRGV